MENSISIPSSHLKYLVPGYKQRLEEIDILIKKLELERKEIEKIINTVDENHILSSKPTIGELKVPNDNYDKDLSLFSKAKFILKKEGKPLTTAQIVEGILLYEPSLNRTLMIRNISSILGLKSKEDKGIERFILSGKNQKFGLK